MLEQLIQRFQALKAISDRITEEATKAGAGWDIMACKDLAGETAEDRFTALKAMRANLDAMKIEIDELQKQATAAAEEAKKTAGGEPTEKELPSQYSPVQPGQQTQELRPKSWAWDSPLVELAKAMFDNQDFRDIAKHGIKPQFSKRIEGNFEAVKAVLSNAGTIQAGAITPALLEPYQVLEVCYFMPWPSEVYRRRIAPRTAPEQRDRSATAAAGGSAATLASTDFPLQTTIGVQPIDNMAYMADANIQVAYTDMIMMDVRKALADQVVAGSGSGQNLFGLTHANNRGTSAVAANTNVLDHATNGIHPRVLGVREAGGKANYILAKSADVGKIYSELTNQRSPFLQTQRLPYGAPMGAGVIMTPQLGNNQAMIVSLGEPSDHLIAVMGDVMVETDPSVYFDRDQVAIRGKVYAANVVMNAGGNHLFTTTNNWTTT